MEFESVLAKSYKTNKIRWHQLIKPNNYYHKIKINKLKGNASIYSVIHNNSNSNISKLNKYWKSIKFDLFESQIVQDPSSFRDCECSKCKGKLELLPHCICKHCSNFFHWSCLSTPQKEAFNLTRARINSVENPAVKQNLINIFFWTCDQCRICNLCLNQINSSSKHEYITCSKCLRYFHKNCLKVNYEFDRNTLKEK